MCCTGGPNGAGTTLDSSATCHNSVLTILIAEFGGRGFGDRWPFGGERRGDGGGKSPMAGLSVRGPHPASPARHRPHRHSKRVDFIGLCNIIAVFRILMYLHFGVCIYSCMLHFGRGAFLWFVIFCGFVSDRAYSCVFGVVNMCKYLFYFLRLLICNCSCALHGEVFCLFVCVVGSGGT